MRNIIAICFIAIMISSCGSTKEVEVIPQPISKEERASPRMIASKNKKPKTKAEQIAVQLGLSKEKEAEFLIMWNTTNDAMKNTRNQKYEDKKVWLDSLRKIKNDRQEGLINILSDAQLAKYYAIMSAKDDELGANPIKKGN